MPLVFLLIFGGALLAYMGYKNVSLKGILSDTLDPISRRTHEQLQFGSSDAAVIAGAGATGTVPSGVTATGAAGATQRLALALRGTPYSTAGHSTAINETIAQVKRVGTDCSGYVSALMGPHGLGIWHTAYATPSIPTAPGILSGVGNQITLWNNPAAGSKGHVFIQFSLSPGQNRYFEEAGGVGAHEMTQAQADNYLRSGLYTPYHPQGY